MRETHRSGWMKHSALAFLLAALLSGCNISEDDINSLSPEAKQDIANQAATVGLTLPPPFPEPDITPEPSAEPSATPVVTLTPTPTPVPTATARPTLKPTTTPVSTPKPTATAKPTPSPKPIATATPTVKPTATPTVKPTATPTVKPTATPTIKPTATPTQQPTATPVALDLVSLKLSWTLPSARVDGSPLSPQEVDHYTIYVGTQPDVLSGQAKVVDVGQNQLVVNDVERGGDYYFAIDIVDIYGNSSALSNVNHIRL